MLLVYVCVHRFYTRSYIELQRIDAVRHSLHCTTLIWPNCMPRHAKCCALNMSGHCATVCIDLPEPGLLL